MAGLGPHQISPPHAESANVHRQGELHNLEHGNHVDNQRRAAHKHSMPVEAVIDERVIWYMSKLTQRICHQKLMI